jgi:hypothetical protein
VTGILFFCFFAAIVGRTFERECDYTVANSAMMGP